jgi:hypothetical protein
VAWNDGCLPRPTTADGARPVRFPWDEADALGQALAAGREALAANVTARADGERLFLGDWQGAHRNEFAAERAEHEAVLTADPLGTALSTLRSAWDDAAERQAAENRSAVAAAEAAAEPTCD